MALRSLSLFYYEGHRDLEGCRFSSEVQMQELAGEMKNEIPKKMGWKDLPWRAQRSQRFLSFESSLYVGNIEECRNSEKEEGEVYHRGHRDHRDV